MSVFIIAEAGVNHNGSLEQALQLVDVAVEAGADAVKFQTFKAENIVSQTAQQATYQVENTGVKETQFAMLKRLELDEKAHNALMAYCQTKQIEFMSTPFDDESILLLHKLGMQRWKIPSGELLSVPYLRKIAVYNQPTILSTGMGSLNEVTFAVKTLLNSGLNPINLTVLHANTAYPTPYQDVNLNAMLTLATALKLEIGLSDHSPGIEVPIAAVAMGAKVIEKHFTFDKTLPGPDHKASLEPHELKAMVQGIRNIELALGQGNKQATLSEEQNKTVARKRIVAKVAVAKGELLTEQNLTLQRHTEGVFANEWDNWVGKKASKSYAQGEALGV